MENNVPIKILHFHFGKDGGAERFFVNLARAMGERGIAQQFIIRRDRAWKREIEHLGNITEDNFNYLSLSPLRLRWQARRIIRDWQPDAVLAWAPRASRLLPNISPLRKITRLGDYPPPKLLNRHLKNADIIVVNTPDIKTHLERLGWRRPIRVITNFAREVAPQPINRADLNTPEDAFVICGAGRFVPCKGMDILIRVAAQVAGAYLWLLGDGEERRALEKLAADVGVAARTRFVGWVAEPTHYIAAADVFGMPSRHEPLGNAVLDAWRAGAPVVSTRSEGPDWFMTDGVNGLLVDIDDTAAFAAAITKIRADRALARALSAGGAAELAGRFSREQITDQYLTLITSPPQNAVNSTHTQPAVGL